MHVCVSVRACVFAHMPCFATGAYDLEGYVLDSQVFRNRVMDGEITKQVY